MPGEDTLRSGGIRDEPATDMPPRWPNLFLVGVVRGGTTSLWAYLDQHPEIFMASVKEPHFFTNASPTLAPTYKEERAYLDLFAGAQEAVRGEASASYFADSASPIAIKRVSPEAKILVSLREPVERAYSHYWHQLTFGKETRSFAEAVQEDLAGKRREGLDGYVRRGFYSEQLQRYLDTFGRSVHVVFLEEMTQDPVRVMRGVFAFLGVEPAVADQLVLERRNTFRLPRGRVAKSMIDSQRLRAAARLVVPVRFRPRLEQALLAPRGKLPMEPEVRRQLEDIYASDGAALAEILERPLPWSKRDG
jgi:Sulfotransferase domain